MKRNRDVVLNMVDEYLKGFMTAKDVFREVTKLEGLESIKSGYHVVPELLKLVGLNEFDSIELENKFEGANREGIIKLIENYQNDKLTALEVEIWADANECWTIVKNEKTDRLAQDLINEFGFGEMHLEELFTNKVMNHLKIMLVHKESQEIEDFKLTTVFKHHKRRLANALKELKATGDPKQLESYIKERSELKIQSKLIEELITKSTIQIEENIKLIDKIITKYINGVWKASS